MWLVLLPFLMFALPVLLVFGYVGNFHLIDSLNLYIVVVGMISIFSTVALLSPIHRYRILSPDPEGVLYKYPASTNLAKSNIKYIECLMTPLVIYYALCVMPKSINWPMDACLLSVQASFMIAMLAHQTVPLRKYAKYNCVISTCLMLSLVAYASFFI